MAGRAVAQSQSAQPGAAHSELRGSAGEFGGVAFPLRVGAAGVVGVFVKRHHGVAVIVRFLNPRLALAVEDQSPDVARTLAGDLEVRTVVAELRHARLVELLLLAGRRADLAVVE